MAKQSSQILIVDDTPIDIRILFDVLKEAGYYTLIANTGEEAIKQLELITPELILLDVMMPGIGGFETCKRIKANKRNKNIPIIFMTALDNTQDKVRAFKIGAVDYITKPFQKEEVIARVTVHIQLYQLTQTVQAQAHSLEKSNHFLEQANRKLKKLANLDGLTKLANRRRFDGYIKQQWQQALGGQYFLSLILCDVDYFKQYNDYYGHLAGDECLKQIASALQRSIQHPADLVARYGGEEFGIILPNTDDFGVIKVIQQIQDNIHQLKIPHVCSQVSPQITLSLGASTIIPHSSVSSDFLVLATDQQLYDAKDKGRNTYCVKSLTVNSE